MQGLIGNNLFQYAFARILAEDLGYALEVKHSRYKPGKNIPQLEEMFSHFRDAPLAIDGKRFSRPVDRTALIGYNGFDGFRIDLEEMRNCRRDRKILIKGFFERYEIFRPHKSRIRSWFAVNPIGLGYHIAPDDIVIHIRRGDFIVFARAISLSFYLDLLEKLDFARLYICGFGLDEEVKAGFRKFDPLYIAGSPIDDFRFMIGFNRIILSQSTFAWWASFLSQAEEIHAPVPLSNSTPFERTYPHINLRVDDESRYHYVHEVPYLERVPTIADMVAARQQLPLLSGLRFLLTLLKNRLLESGAGSALVWGSGDWNPCNGACTGCAGTNEEVTGSTGRISRCWGGIGKSSSSESTTPMQAFSLTSPLPSTSSCSASETSACPWCFSANRPQTATIPTMTPAAAGTCGSTSSSPSPGSATSRCNNGWRIRSTLCNRQTW